MTSFLDLLKIKYLESFADVFSNGAAEVGLSRVESRICGSGIDKRKGCNYQTMGAGDDGGRGCCSTTCLGKLKRVSVVGGCSRLVDGIDADEDGNEDEDVYR